ncbi:MAG: hypothetical protein HQM10_24635 [Candidatus Riflebacteria bacterium]|nr:hypothetical protein [Candidatus Riflebacteria bacterium]
MQLIRIIRIISVLIILSAPFTAFASQLLVPEWYNFSASLSGAPVLGEKVSVNARLSCLIGTINDITISIKLPPGWKANSESLFLKNLSSGTTHVFTFEAEALAIASAGSLLCSVTGKTPVKDLSQYAEQFPDQKSELLSRIQKMPEIFSSSDEVVFSLYAEEGFYPLTGDTWLAYDERIKSPRFEKGPVFYRDTLLSRAQAEYVTDMYKRLEKKIAESAGFAETLSSSGINLKSKQYDALKAYYVLAQESYLSGDFNSVSLHLSSFERLLPGFSLESVNNLKIAARNLQALNAWLNGDRRTAEKIFRETFYSGRKQPIQRYILRNMAIINTEKGDMAIARESLRIALDLKKEYSLLKKEFERFDAK